MIDIPQDIKMRLIDAKYYLLDEPPRIDLALTCIELALEDLNDETGK